MAGRECGARADRVDCVRDAARIVHEIALGLIDIYKDASAEGVGKRPRCGYMAGRCARIKFIARAAGYLQMIARIGRRDRYNAGGDRKRVVMGKSVSGRLDPGGWRTFKTK